MKTDFDFDKIGKREPYLTPEGFFERLEKDIISETTASRTCHWPLWKPILTKMASFAAEGAILLAIAFSMFNNTGNSMDDVENAFTRLSETEQDFIIESYQDDIFINS